MIEKVEFRKTRDFGEIVSDTFIFVKQNFKPLFKTTAYLCGFFMVAAIVSTILQQVGAQNALKEGFVNRSDTTPFEMFAQKVFTIHYFLAVIFSFLGYTAIYVTINVFVVLYVQKGNVAPTIEESWSYFKYFFFRILGSSVLLFLFMMICMVACLVPFFYVFPAVSLFYPIMMVENSDFTYAFKKSFRLLKDQWWITAATLFVLWIIVYAIMAFALMPAMIAGLITGFTQGAGTISTIMVAVTTIIQYVCYIFLAIPMIGTSLCYFNLVERQENTGLLDRIDQFGQSGTDLHSEAEQY